MSLICYFKDCWCGAAEIPHVDLDMPKNVQHSRGFLVALLLDPNVETTTAFNDVYRWHPAFNQSLSIPFHSRSLYHASRALVVQKSCLSYRVFHFLETRFCRPH